MPRLCIACVTPCNRILWPANALFVVSTDIHCLCACLEFSLARSRYLLVSQSLAVVLTLRQTLGHGGGRVHKGVFVELALELNIHILALGFFLGLGLFACKRFLRLLDSGQPSKRRTQGRKEGKGEKIYTTSSASKIVTKQYTQETQHIDRTLESSEGINNYRMH